MSVDVSPFELTAGDTETPVRAVGVACLTAECAAGETVAMEIDEQGPLRLRFPRVRTGRSLEAVLVNTGGGVVSGDRLRFEVRAGEGASISITTQAAEKIYRSSGARAEIDVRLSAEPRARLAWLPQETILFDRARVARAIEADLAADATLTICEPVIFGRQAMGERVHDGTLRDRWRIRREGRLVFAETLTLDGAISTTLAKPAIAGGASAAATLVQVSQSAESKLDAVRRALDRREIEAGASAFGGILVARMLARDGLELRTAVLAALAAVGTEPPRVYTL